MEICLTKHVQYRVCVNMNPKKSLSNYVYFIREYGTQVVINGDPEKGNKHLY